MSKRFLTIHVSPEAVQDFLSTMASMRGAGYSDDFIAFYHAVKDAAAKAPMEVVGDKPDEVHSTREALLTHFAMNAPEPDPLFMPRPESILVPKPDFWDAEGALGIPRVDAVLLLAIKDVEAQWRRQVLNPLIAVQWPWEYARRMLAERDKAIEALSRS